MPFTFSRGDRMKDTFVGLGDMLISFSPPGYRRFLQADTMDVSYTGAEANVCFSLAMLGAKTRFVTRLPDNDIARCAVNKMKGFGIDTSAIAYGGDRMGVIYTEKGAAQRPSKVIYDRGGTSFARIKETDLDWDAVFADAAWFHFTGITAALSGNTRRLCLRACREAKARNITVSCDLNYRKKLWSEQTARQVMSQLMQYVDVVIGNEEDAERVLGIKAANSDVISGKLSNSDYEHTAGEIMDQFGVKKVAFTMRRSLSASDNEWSAVFFDQGKVCYSRIYTIHIVNRVGGGDAFSAGLIYSLMNGFEQQKAVEFAAAASCLKHSIELDVNLSTVNEVMTLVNGDGSGRVQR